MHQRVMTTYVFFSSEENDFPEAKNVVKCDECLMSQSGYQEKGQQIPTIHQLIPWRPTRMKQALHNRYQGIQPRREQV